MLLIEATEIMILRSRKLGQISRSLENSSYAIVTANTMVECPREKKRPQVTGSCPIETRLRVTCTSAVSIIPRALQRTPHVVNRDDMVHICLPTARSALPLFPAITRLTKTVPQPQRPRDKRQAEDTPTLWNRREQSDGGAPEQEVGEHFTDEEDERTAEQRQLACAPELEWGQHGSCLEPERELGEVVGGKQTRSKETGSSLGALTFPESRQSQFSAVSAPWLSPAADKSASETQAAAAAPRQPRTRPTSTPPLLAKRGSPTSTAAPAAAQLSRNTSTPGRLSWGGGQIEPLGERAAARERGAAGFPRSMRERAAVGALRRGTWLWGVIFCFGGTKQLYLRGSK